MVREERLFKKARVTLKKELDIVKFIKNLRHINQLQKKVETRFFANEPI